MSVEKARLRTLIIGFILAAAGAFLLASFLSYDPHEGPFPDHPANEAIANACGKAGACIAAYGFGAVGWVCVAVSALSVLSGLVLVFNIRPRQLSLKMTGILLGFVALTIGLAVFNSQDAFLSGPYRAGAGRGSGALGILLAMRMNEGLGSTGTLIVFLLLCVVSAALVGGVQLQALSALLGKALSALAASLKRLCVREPQPVASPALQTAMAGSAPGPAALSQEDLVPVEYEPKELPARMATTKPLPEAEVEEESAPEVITNAGLRDYEPPAPPADAEEHEAEEEFEQEPTPPAGISEFAGERAGELSLPPVDLLDEFVASNEAEDEEDIRIKGQVLERTLNDFGIVAKVVRVKQGPVITMYELALSPGTKVSRVESLADDMAIALKAPNVRIVAPIPGKSTVGVEVPNTQRELVCLRELMGETENKVRSMEIPLFLGKDTGGSPIVIDLALAPHLLIAGATGSGKSVAIASMIISILMTRLPDTVQLMLIDPKGVEFSDYRDLPHLMCPILTDMKKAAAVLQWACKKMDERYALLSRVGVRDLKGYNNLGREEIEERLNPEGDADLDDVAFSMPHIVIVVDELGELMMIAAKEVESSVIRLSQKARAVGIHLICATQRPSVDVITGLIKANLPARVAFQVPSKVDSRTILDRNGAELLLGRGDMLILPPGTSRLIRAQGTYVSEEEALRIVDFLRRQTLPRFDEELRDYHASQGVSDTDDLFDDAVRIILETQRGSVSLLQRRLSIGYSRAARLIDLMAEAGIVGTYRGSQAREVMLTLDEWDAARNKNRPTN